MNNNTKWLVIGLTVIIVAAAVCIVVFSGGNDDGYEPEETGRLLVYGNANNDDFIDRHDVDYIQDIIDGNIEWDSAAYPFADTNADGNVTEADIELLNKYLNNESCIIYYQDVWDEVGQVHYPFTGQLGLMDWRQADLAVSLGLWDRVAACGTAGMNDIKTPGYMDKAIYGSGYYVEAETVIQSGNDLGVSVLLAYTGSDGTAYSLKQALNGSNSGIDIIAVDRTDLRTMSLTTGALLGVADKAREYVDYADWVEEDLQERLTGLDDDEKKSVMLIQIFRTTDAGNISVMVNGPSPHPLFDILYNYTDTEMVTPIDYGSGWYSVVNLEWIIEQDPDYIIFTVASSLWSGNISESEVESQFLNYCDTYFSQTSAYRNGNIIATDHSCFGGQMSFFTAYKVVSMIYPDKFDEGDGDKVLNDWHDQGFALWSLDELAGTKVRCLADYR